MILQDVGICMTFPGKYPQNPDRYLQKRVCGREMFQGSASSSAPNIFPDVLTVYCAIQENLYLGSMSSVRMGLTMLL